MIYKAPLRSIGSSGLIGALWEQYGSYLRPNYPPEYCFHLIWLLDSSLTATQQSLDFGVQKHLPLVMAASGDVSMKDQCQRELQVGT